MFVQLKVILTGLHCRVWIIFCFLFFFCSKLIRLAVVPLLLFHQANLYSFIPLRLAISVIK